MFLTIYILKTKARIGTDVEPLAINNIHPQVELTENEAHPSH